MTRRWEGHVDRAVSALGAWEAVNTIVVQVDAPEAYEAQHELRQAVPVRWLALPAEQMVCRGAGISGGA